MVVALALRTPLCDLLRIEVPIVAAPMAGATTPGLVAAVSGAGGLGVLAGTRLAPDELRAAIGAVRAATDRPFGVNFLLAPPEEGNHDLPAMQRFLDRFRAELGLPAGRDDLTLPPSPLPALLDVVYEEEVPVVSFALGDPGPLVARAHEAGAIVVAMVTTIEEAVHVVQEGVDVVVAQGAEAGGHRSALELGPQEEPPLVGTLALVPQVVDAVSVPVVAAGGIADGRGVAAALALGADGAQLGTRFLVSRESGAFPAWKAALLAATETDTLVTRAYTGRPARGVRNVLVDELLAGGPPTLAWPLQSLAAEDIYRAAAERDEAGLFPLLGGQATRLLRREAGAAEIVDDLVTEARACLRRLGGLAG
jgi:nitronate monooxygenase